MSKTNNLMWFNGHGNCLWEVRSHLEGRIARVLFSVIDGHMVLLHAFIKKAQKTPRSDLDTARARKAML